MRILSYGNPDLNSILQLSYEGLKIDHDYNKLSLFNFHTLKLQKSGALWLNHPELDRYLDIYFIEEAADWYKY